MDRLSQDRLCCTQILRESRSSFYFSFAVLPKERREALMSIYAFCRLVDDVADNCSDAAVAEAKLLWWRQEIQRVFDDRAGAEPPQHPVGRCLRDDVKRFALEHEYFTGILDGVVSDLHWQVCPNRAQLMQYCYRVSCCVGLLSVGVFGYERDEIRHYATQLGYAMQLTNIIRDVRQDAMRGRVYLPADELRASGVDPAQLAVARTTPDSLRLYLNGLGDEVGQMFASALAILDPSEYRQQLAGIVMARTYLRLLNEIKRDNYCVIEYRLALPPRQKIYILLESVIRANLRLGFGFKSKHT